MWRCTLVIRVEANSSLLLHLLNSSFPSIRHMRMMKRTRKVQYSPENKRFFSSSLKVLNFIAIGCSSVRELSRETMQEEEEMTFEEIIERAFAKKVDYIYLRRYLSRAENKKSK